MAQITNDLLKQAIADAEAVRETAVANAKLVLEEAITPQIRDMIARRLRVEAENPSVDSDEAEEGDDEELHEEVAAEKPHEEGEAEGSSEMPADSSDVGHGDNKEPSDDAFDASGIGTGPENAGTSGDDWYEDWSESDFDLHEVIAELEADIAALTEVPQLEEAEEEELGTDSQKHPHAHADAKLKMDAVHADEDTSEESDDEELDLEEILAELEAEEEGEEHEEDVVEAEEAPVGSAPDHEKEEMAAEIAMLRGEMATYREAINTLRGKLNEINLLNAKLLFTNKMFRKEGLSNDQKVRIVESFDRATTVREVKLVYTALMENISVSKSAPSASRKKVVAEGIASKATPSTAPKSDVIVENTVAKRLQELAGLI
jgi:hypothetical protein